MWGLTLTQTVAGTVGRAPEPRRQVDLPEAALSEQPPDAVGESGFRAGDGFVLAEEPAGVRTGRERSLPAWWRRWRVAASSPLPRETPLLRLRSQAMAGGSSETAITTATTKWMRSSMLGTRFPSV